MRLAADFGAAGTAVAAAEVAAGTPGVAERNTPYDSNR